MSKDAREVLLKKDEVVTVQPTDPIDEENKQEQEHPDTIQGKLLFVASGVIFCLNFMSGKILYQNHPDLSANQLLLYRSAVSMVLLIFWLNKNIKKVMIDDISSDSLPHLAVRIITGNFAIFVNFMSVKYFALTIVAMIINTAPLLTVFLAGPLLKEQVYINDIISVMVAIGAIALMILGGSSETQTTAAYTPDVIAYIVLLLNPVCIAAGNLAMRRMRKLDDNVVSAYMALSLFVIFLPICLLHPDQSVFYIKNFSFGDWVALIAISIGTILSQSLRFMAIKIHSVSGLQPYTFIQPLQQFLTDIIVFGQGFSVIQFVGVQLLIFVYVAQYFLQCCVKLQQRKNEDLLDQAD